MSNVFRSRLNQSQRMFYSMMAIALISTLSFGLSPYLGYKVVAYLLLVTVSLLAMVMDIWSVLAAAILSALIWDFFFIPPVYNFHVASTEDTLMLLMYFIVALVNGVLTFQIRKGQREIEQHEKKQTALDLYNTLLNSLSHELRTPIAAIIGASDNLNHNGNKLSDEHKKELLNEISIASVRLNQQVENLLNMSRLESGIIQPKLDWCDAKEMVYSVVDKLKDNLQQHKIEIDIPDETPLFKLDAGLMEQVLHNLIYNAAVYTPENSLIKMSVKCVQDCFVLTVEDNGNGFPIETLTKVFDKFYRIQTSSTKGTGLGLSIVKGFVEAHGGTIDLKNKTTGGAIFTIEIPTEISYLNNIKND
jgi:two-component system, OmpR family, sensor histidine kinase KdpD